MFRRSSRGKDIVADELATPVAKRTRLSSQASQDPNEDRDRKSTRLNSSHDVISRMPYLFAYHGHDNLSH